MKDTITLPREWFEKLKLIRGVYTNAPNPESLQFLIGYLLSVETILKLKQ